MEESIVTWMVLIVSAMCGLWQVLKIAVAEDARRKAECEDFWREVHGYETY